MKNLLTKILPILLIISFLAIKNCTNSPQKIPNNSASTASPTMPSATTKSSSESSRNPEIPQKVYDVFNYVRANHQAMDGYVGGRHFGNFEGNLPNNDAAGNKINYQEWDVNPHLEHKNRGTERLITGSDGRAYFTNNHYQSFTEIK